MQGSTRTNFGSVFPRFRRRRWSGAAAARSQMQGERSWGAAHDILTRFEDEQLEASTDSEGNDDPNASNTFGRQWQDKRALWESAKLMKKMSSSIGLGICASTPERGIRELEGWVCGLHLKHNELHRYDGEDPIRGPVYIRYSSRTGDAYLREYGGKFQGVEFSPKMKSGGRFEYSVLPMGLYREQKHVALERIPIDWNQQKKRMAAAAAAGFMKPEGQQQKQEEEQQHQEEQEHSGRISGQSQQPRVLSANALKVSNPQEIVPPPPPPMEYAEEEEDDKFLESDEFIKWEDLQNRVRAKIAKLYAKYGTKLTPNDLVCPNKGPGSIYYSVQSFIDKKIHKELAERHLEVKVEKVVEYDVYLTVASDTHGVIWDKDVCYRSHANESLHIPRILLFPRLLSPIVCGYDVDVGMVR
uniref:Uncharacterized protein n=1 Tax=Lotharella oceanica TaxID=641309 RepID=A0A7S2TYW7_9EUKA